MASYWDKYGGKDTYIKSQQERYKQAVQSGDTNLINRLKADAARVGYSLPTVSTPKSTGSSSDYWSRYTGGKEGYIQSQQKRYIQAAQSGDTDLMKRLEADAARVGYSLPQVQAQQTAQQLVQQQPLPQDVMAQLGQQLQQYLFPYEQLMRDIMAQMPTYQQPSQEELLQQAKTWANLQIDPAIQAISQALAQTKQALETQQAKTEAAYAGLEQATQRFMQEAAQKALESAIARGGGRSGQVEWYTSKLQQPIAEQYAQAQAQRAAELADIANRMTLAEQQAAEQQKALEQRRGELEAERLAELQNLAHATAVGDWQRAFQAAQNLASMATQAQQWGLSYAAGLLPYFALTESERQNLPLQWAQVVGQVPSATVPATGVTGYYVPLREYASQLGASIDYDPVTNEVIINGRRYSVNALAGLGGRMTNGRWYLPASALQSLLQ